MQFVLTTFLPRYICAEGNVVIYSSKSQCLKAHSHIIYDVFALSKVLSYNSFDNFVYTEDSHQGLVPEMD